MPKTNSDPYRICDIPKGGSFILLTIELLCSDAWKTMPINCRRLIDFLIIEHCNHAGFENGNLIATYDQLAGCGISRRYISRAINEAEKRRLLLVHRKGRESRNKSYLNRYTLTFFKAKYFNPDGSRFYAEPTNEWKRFKK